VSCIICYEMVTLNMCVFGYWYRQTQKELDELHIIVQELSGKLEASEHEVTTQVSRTRWRAGCLLFAVCDCDVLCLLPNNVLCIRYVVRPYQMWTIAINVFVAWCVSHSVCLRPAKRLNESKWLLLGPKKRCIKRASRRGSRCGFCWITMATC